MGKNPLISLIGYYIPAGIFPRHTEAATPCRRLRPGGGGELGPVPIAGHRGGRHCPPAPKSLLSQPRGDIGHLLGHCQPASCSRSHQGICMLSPRKRALLLGRYFAFRSILGGWCQVGACPAVAAGGTPVPWPPKSFWVVGAMGIYGRFFMVAFLLFITILQSSDTLTNSTGDSVFGF